MSFYREVITELENNDVGVFGNDLFLGSSPQLNIRHLTVYNTGGNPPQKDQTKSMTVQFITKAEKYNDAEDLILSADEVVRERYHSFFGDYLVILMEARGEPGHIGTDENGNHLFSANYDAIVRKLNY